jgi:hypothetical protein
MKSCLIILNISFTLLKIAQAQFHDNLNIAVETPVINIAQFSRHHITLVYYLPVTNWFAKTSITKIVAIRILYMNIEHAINFVSTVGKVECCHNEKFSFLSLFFEAVLHARLVPSEIHLKLRFE